MDKSTEQCRRIDIAKICVEVQRDDFLPSSIDLNIEGVGLIEIDVEYPCKLYVCSICKGFGHNDQNCIKSKRVWRVKTPAPGHSDCSKPSEPSLHENVPVPVTTTSKPSIVAAGCAGVSSSPAGVASCSDAKFPNVFSAPNKGKSKAAKENIT